MKKRTLVCYRHNLLLILAYFFLILSPVLVAAETITLYPVDIASGEDEGPKDGVFDNFINSGVPSLLDNGYTEFRIAAEFDLSSITGSIATATLSFVAESSNTPALIEIHGFNGNGSIELTDFGFVSNLLGNVPGTIGVNNLDVTNFITSPVPGNFAGFCFDEAFRGDTPTTNRFSTFKLVIETEAVNNGPLPAIIFLLNN